MNDVCDDDDSIECSEFEWAMEKEGTIDEWKVMSKQYALICNEEN